MLVSTAPFFVFLGAVCLLYWVTAGVRRLQLAVLLLANLFFLAHFSVIYLALPLAATVDFLVGLGMGKWERIRARRLLLGVSLAVNLGLMESLGLALYAESFLLLFSVA